MCGAEKRLLTCHNKPTVWNPAEEKKKILKNNFKYCQKMIKLKRYNTFKTCYSGKIQLTLCEKWHTPGLWTCLCQCRVGHWGISHREGTPTAALWFQTSKLSNIIPKQKKYWLASLSCWCKWRGDITSLKLMEHEKLSCSVKISICFPASLKHEET